MKRMPKPGPKRLISVEETFVEALQSSPIMLTDLNIGAVLQMLKDQFPQMQMLQDPVVRSKLQFDISHGSFVQVMHDGSLHWVTVVNIFSIENNAVELYDSLYSSVPMSVKMQIANILSTQEKKKLVIRVKKFQRQKGGVDCGLFAIAAATDLCNGQDPSLKSYRQDEMRSHLLLNLEDGVILPFASTTVKEIGTTLKTVNVPLWCECRLPDNMIEKMAECSGCDTFFHKTCASIPKEVFKCKDKAKEWRCRKCEAK